MIRSSVLLAGSWQALMLELVVDLEEDIKGVDHRALAGGWTTELELVRVRDTLVDPSRELGPLASLPRNQGRIWS